VRRSINLATMQAGQKRGGSGVSSALGDIPCPYHADGRGGPDGDNVLTLMSSHVSTVDSYKDDMLSTWDRGKAQLLDSQNE
jgi:hypothetical protein